MISQSTSPRPRSVNRTALLALTGAGLFLAALDAYVVVAALEPMLFHRNSLGVPANHLERAIPLITGFLCGYLALMPLAGGLSDRFGRTRTFAAFLILFGAGSLVTATAHDVGQAVLGRVLQGAGGGALVPIALALAADLYAGPGRTPVLGGMSALQEVGSVVGPLWGGVIAAGPDDRWRWIFWLNLVFVAALLYLAWPSVRARPMARTPRSLDLPGAFFAGAGLALLTLALYAEDPSRSPVGSAFLWQFPLALLLFVVFAVREGRTRDPLIRLGYFKDSAFTGAALTNAIAGAGLMVALVFIPVLAQSPIFNLGSGDAAWLLLRLMLGIPVGALAGGFLARRLGSHRAVAALGMALAAVGLFWLSGWDQDALHRTLPLFGLHAADLQLFAVGLGLGLEIAPVSAALLDVVGAPERGAGASLLVVMRMLGMLVGFSALSGFGLYHFNRATAHLLPPLFSIGPDYALRYTRYLLQLRAAILDEYHVIFAVTAVIVMAGAVIAAATLRPPRPARA